jgi:uncharacterized membrane protein YccF (DUF307 family)
MTKVEIQGQRNPGCLVQLLWFALVGWWAGQVWVAIAWGLMVTIIGIPLGVAMLNRVPEVIALRNPLATATVTHVDGDTVVTRGIEVPQHNLLLRALYFLLIGWWLSALWIEFAYALCVSIIGLPIGLWMYDRVPALVSLRR